MGLQLFVLTGASRGLGAAMTEQLIAPGHQLLCLSRKTSGALAARAQALGVVCEQWPIDLAQPLEAAARLQAWLQQWPATRFDVATLINNAGVITRVGPADENTDADLSAALRVSLEAPVLLTAAFLRATRPWKAPRRVLNISSGLGRRAMAGSAGYCAAKAGMDHFSRAVALDEAQRAGGARIVSLAPGVIDTDMQVQLRAADPAGFPEQGNFVKLKDGGLLTSPGDAAARVLAYLERPEFGSNPVADVRDA
jgi:NAD(P)-dependent dehydrogenase (short-subunit alcohol dehydrogenase family)